MFHERKVFNRQNKLVVDRLYTLVHDFRSLAVGKKTFQERVIYLFEIISSCMYEKKDNWRTYTHRFPYNAISLFKISVEFGGEKAVRREAIKRLSQKVANVSNTVEQFLVISCKTTQSCVITKHSRICNIFVYKWSLFTVSIFHRFSAFIFTIIKT